MYLYSKRFVDSMKLLSENGLTVSIYGKDHHFNVGLLAFLADTLGAHAFGSFQESMSFSHRICRSCMATTEQIQTNFVESDCILRTAMAHRQHVSILDSSASVEYGINRQSELEGIPNFSVAENLPHDIMHDLFEGVLPYEIKLLLTILMGNNYLTLSVLNEHIIFLTLVL